MKKKKNNSNSYNNKLTLNYFNLKMIMKKNKLSIKNKCINFNLKSFMKNLIWIQLLNIKFIQSRKMQLINKKDYN